MAKNTNKTTETAKRNLHRALMYREDMANPFRVEDAISLFCPSPDILEIVEGYAEKLEKIMEERDGRICEAITETDPEELKAAADRGEVPEELKAAIYSIVTAAAELGFLTGYDIAARLSSNT